MNIGGDGMASLAEILQLDKTQASIKKIDLFLLGQVKLSDEYQAALAYKALILHKIGKTNDALKYLFAEVPSFKIMSSRAVTYICDALIDIYIDEFRFDQVDKYINIKRNYLPASMLHLYTKDRIKLFLAMKDNKRAKESLLHYLEDDIDRHEQVYAKEELGRIYLEEHQYDKYLELTSFLEAYYQDNVALDKLAMLDINRYRIAYENGNYLKVITEGNKFLGQSLKVEYILLCAAIVIKSYIAVDDYKKAAIFESYYEEYASTEHPNESIEFCYAAIELYRKTNSLISIKNYENKIKEIEAKLEPISRSKKTKKKDEVIVSNNHEVLVPPKMEEHYVVPNVSVLNPQPVIAKDITIVSPSKTNIKNIAVSEAYNSLIDIFNSLNELDVNLKFREIFRNTMIHIAKKFNIEEAYLLYYKGKYLGLHYKKERAYDKKLTFDSIENTLSYAAMKYDSEQFLDQSENAYNTNIVTNKEYDSDIYGFAIPIHSSIETIGSIAFFASKPFLDKEVTYEALKLIVGMLNSRLLLHFKQEENNLNNQKLYFLKDKLTSGLKEEIDGYIHLSDQAVNILGAMHDLSEADYFNCMKAEDIIKYRAIHDELYRCLTDGLSLEYSFKNDGNWIKVKETYFPLNIDGSIYIYSLIDDITEAAKKEEALMDLAYNNPISNMQTELKLLNDLQAELGDRKLSLCLCEVVDFNLYKELYGYKFRNQLIYALGLRLKEAFSSDFRVSVYHIESDRFAILFRDTNDKRLVDSKLIKAFDYVSKKLFELNSRLSIKFNAGVYRLAKNVSSITESEILNNAYDALYDSVDMKSHENHINHYANEAQKERIKMNSIVTHISEAIDSNNIGLTYQQIVDLSETSVYGYYININLDNFEIDDSYMQMVIKRRGLERRVDDYKMFSIFKEQKMFYDQFKGYLKLFVHIELDSIDIKFYTHMHELLQFIKINPEYIVIHSSSVNNKALQALRNDGFMLCSSDILDVFRGNCDYFMYDYHRVGEDSINEVRELCSKNNCRCILGGIDTPADIEMARANGYDLVYGKFYNKLNRIKTIIERLKK